MIKTKINLSAGGFDYLIV